MKDKAVTITIKPNLHVAKEHFGIQTTSDGLELPTEFQELVVIYRITNASRLLSALELSPLDFALRFGWQQPDIDAATKQLTDLLNQTFPRKRPWGTRPTDLQTPSQGVSLPSDIPRP